MKPAPVALAHAAVQVLAEDCGADVLHIKGPAVDDSLLDSRPAQDAEADGESTEVVRRSSIDADVLVRPGHVQRLLEAMQSSGRWTSVSRFEDSSPFEHDATLEHPFLGHTDVHRWFPGIGCEPETAFGQLTSACRFCGLAKWRHSSRSSSASAPTSSKSRRFSFWMYR